jgi:hypothetical protein
MGSKLEPFGVKIYHSKRKALRKALILNRILKVAFFDVVPQKTLDRQDEGGYHG